MSLLMVSDMPISDRRGVSLLILSVVLVLLAISLTVVIPRADLDLRREKEDELRFRLGEFRRAVGKFVRCHNRQPALIEELLRDSSGNRFLRKSYPDPMTGRFDWKGETGADGVFYVRSASEENSIGGAKYCDFR